jgi:Glyoxalase-like domain
MPLAARLFAVTLDCPDPLVLARFYQTFAGGRVDEGGPGFAALTTDTIRIDFQRVANPSAEWPGEDTPRRAHLDFAVDDLPTAEAYVLRQGATLAEHQPGGTRFRVLIDPAGHPFCLADAAAVLGET